MTEPAPTAGAVPAVSGDELPAFTAKAAGTAPGRSGRRGLGSRRRRKGSRSWAIRAAAMAWVMAVVILIAAAGCGGAALSPDEPAAPGPGASAGAGTGAAAEPGAPGAGPVASDPGQTPAGGRSAGAGSGPAGETVLLVAAAASLQDALQAVAAAFRQVRPDVMVQFNFGSSGALAAQVEAGAPVDLFVAAGREPVERLVRAGLVTEGDVRVIAGNRLVLVVPAAGDGGPPAVPVKAWADLAGAAVHRVALGDPAHVPAGRYGRQVLEHLGLWGAVEPKLVLDQDVRQVLHHVAAGAADAGIVYATDAATAPGVRVVAPAPAGSHDPIVYPAAVPRAAPHGEAARDLMRFLAGPEGQALLRHYGFLPPP